MTSYRDPMIEQAIQVYHDMMAANLDAAAVSQNQMEEGLAPRGITFKGRPLCDILRPQFFSHHQYETVQKGVKTLMTASNRLKDAMLADPTLMEELDLSDGERRVIAV